MHGVSRRLFFAAVNTRPEPSRAAATASAAVAPVEFSAQTDARIITESMSAQSYLDDIRARLRREVYPSQDELNDIERLLVSSGVFARSREPAENLVVMSNDGTPTSLVAPRWLCHLLGLRHATSHILLTWRSTSMGEVLLLQVRSWTKEHAPGHLDISVGGHVTQGSSPETTAYAEMSQELGIDRGDLANGRLRCIGAYGHFNEKAGESFYNAEWRTIYAGELLPGSLSKVNFRDGEAAGLYLCPRPEASAVLQQTLIPMTTSLQRSLPLWLGQGES